MKTNKLLATVALGAAVVATATSFGGCFAQKDPATLIGCQSGTTAQYFINGDEDWEFDGLKNFEAKGYTSAGLAVTAMKNNNVKYVITDAEPAKKIAQSVSGVKVIDIALTEEEYAFGVDKAQTELKAQINEILASTEFATFLYEIKSDTSKIQPIESAAKDLSKADQQLVVATNAEFAPFEYMEGNKFAGIDMSICDYIAKQLEMELVIINMDFDSVVTSVGTNGIDMAAAALTVNEERAKSVDFTTSYYEAFQVLMVKESETKFDACTTAEQVIAILNGEANKDAE